MDNYSSNDETIFDSENLILKSSIEVFNSMPTPIETAEIISKTGIAMDEEILNPVSNVPYYEISSNMALNLGVYCADISYTSLYEQKALTLDYLSAIKILSDGLGISKLFHKEDIIKLEDNIYNKDSIKIIIEDIFLSSGEFLNENNRPEIALLVEVGAWIEGLYIAMKLSTQSIHINKELVDRIAQQSSSLDLVILSLESYSDYVEIYEVLSDMKQLQKIYKKMHVKTAKKIAKQDDLDSYSDSLINSQIKVTPEIFIDLYNSVNKIRNSYTQ